MTRQPDNTTLLIYWYDGPERTYMNLHWEGKTKQLKRSSPAYGRLKKVLPLLECDYRSYLCGEEVRMYRLTWGEYRSIVDM